MTERAHHLAGDAEREVVEHVLRRAVEPRGCAAVDGEDIAAQWVFDAAVEVFETLDVFEAVHHLFGEAREHGGVFAEELHLDGARRPRQVVEHVLKHLNELGARLGDLLGHPAPHVVDHGVGGAPAARAQAHHDVAGVARRRSRGAQLGARAPRVRHHLGGRAQHALEGARGGLGLAQRGARGAKVVEHEGALVHRGKEAARHARREHAAQRHRTRGASRRPPSDGALPPRARRA